MCSELLATCAPTSAVASSADSRYTYSSETRAVRVDKFRTNRGLPICEQAPFVFRRPAPCGHTHREGLDHEHVVSVCCSSALRTQQYTIRTGVERCVQPAP